MERSAIFFSETCVVSSLPLNLDLREGCAFDQDGRPMSHKLLHHSHDHSSRRLRPAIPRILSHTRLKGGGDPQEAKDGTAE